MGPERLRCHNMRDKRAADRGDRTKRREANGVAASGRTKTTRGSPIVNKRGREASEGRMLEHREPLRAVTISLVLPKHRIHAGNNSHI